MKSSARLRRYIARLSVILLLFAGLVVIPACDTVHTYGGIETEGYYYPDGQGYYHNGYKKHKHKKPKQKKPKYKHGKKHDRHHGRHHDHHDD